MINEQTIFVAKKVRGIKKMNGVNMADLKIREEPLAKEYESFGAQGLTSAIVAKDVGKEKL